MVADQQHSCPLCPQLLLVQQSPEQRLSEAQPEHSSLSVILNALAPSSTIAFVIVGAFRECIMTMLVGPSKAHHAYQQNLNQLTIVTTVEVT